MDKRLISSYLLAALFSTVMSGCGKDDLNTIEGQIQAPGVDYSAVLFHRKAEPPLRSETENISIVKYGQPLLNDIGNVYSACRETTGGKQKLWVNWRSSDTLQVFRDPKTTSYKEEKHFECLTGVLLQTTPFYVEYGDIRDVLRAEEAATKAPPKVVPKAVTKTTKRKRQG